MSNVPFYFYCDEAGELGFAGSSSDNNEGISLMAGLIVEEAQKEDVELFCESLHKQYQSVSDGIKFHITDLNPLQQEDMRTQIFDFIKRKNIKIVYSAIYFSALQRIYRQEQEEHELSVKTMKEKGISLSPRPPFANKRAHSETFYNFYVSAICFAIEKAGQAVRATVIIDYIDGKILDELSKEIDRAHMLSPQYSLNGRRYYYENQSIEKFSVSIADIATTDPRVNALKKSSGTIVTAEPKLSIIADVITNSILHYLDEYKVKSNFGKLNCYDAIEQHPLVNYFIGLNSSHLDNRYPYTH